MVVGEQIVLGLGNNIDYEIVWRSELIERLIIEYGITASDLRTDLPITSTRDLVISILGFLQSETGGERFVTSLELIVDFASRCEKSITVGGTGLRASIAMRKLGYTSALHLVTINADVRSMIPQDSTWVCSNDKKNSVYPHLIVQYPSDTRVQAGDVTIHCKTANRIIYVNDPDNVVMKISPELASLASAAQVFLISGFNAMQSSELLADRLKQLEDTVHTLPPAATVFYEDGCFHHLSLSLQMRDALADFVHIYSLNEDEMQGYLGRKVGLLDPVEVYRALQDLHRLIPVPVIVLHTRHWALAYGAGVSRFADSLKAGITLASTRLRLGDDYTRADYCATERMPVENESAHFAAAITALAGDNVCCMPSIQINQSPATTVGLGDAFVGGFLPRLLAHSQVMQ